MKIKSLSPVPFGKLDNDTPPSVQIVEMGNCSSTLIENQDLKNPTPNREPSIQVNQTPQNVPENPINLQEQEITPTGSKPMALPLDHIFFIYSHEFMASR